MCSRLDRPNSSNTRHTLLFFPHRSRRQRSAGAWAHRQACQVSCAWKRWARIARRACSVLIKLDQTRCELLDLLVRQRVDLRLRANEQLIHECLTCDIVRVSRAIVFETFSSKFARDDDHHPLRRWDKTRFKEQQSKRNYFYHRHQQHLLFTMIWYDLFYGILKIELVLLLLLCIWFEKHK